MQDKHERALRPTADAHHSHRLSFFDDGAFTGMSSDPGLRRFKTLLTFQDPPGLRPRMHVDNAEVARLEVGRGDLDAVRRCFTERDRTHRRAMFAAMVIGSIGLDGIQPRGPKRFERDAVRPYGMIGSASDENSSMCHIAGRGGGDGIGLSATTLHPG